MESERRGGQRWTAGKLTSRLTRDASATTTLTIVVAVTVAIAGGPRSRSRIYLISPRGTTSSTCPSDCFPSLFLSFYLLSLSLFFFPRSSSPSLIRVLCSFSRSFSRSSALAFVRTSTSPFTLALKVAHSSGYSHARESTRAPVCASVYTDAN